MDFLKRTRQSFYRINIPHFGFLRFFSLWSDSVDEFFARVIPQDTESSSVCSVCVSGGTAHEFVPGMVMLTLAMVGGFGWLSPLKRCFSHCGWQVAGWEVASPSGSESVTTVMLAKWWFSLIFLVVVSVWIHGFFYLMCYNLLLSLFILIFIS